MLSAVFPPMPASISSNIRTAILSTSVRILFRASIILDSSPPDAILTRGFGGSPGTECKLFQFIFDELLYPFSHLLATFFLFSERESAQPRSISSFTLSSVFRPQAQGPSFLFLASSLYLRTFSIPSPYFFLSFLINSNLSLILSSLSGSRSFLSLISSQGDGRILD